MALNAGTVSVTLNCEKNLPVADAAGNYEKWAGEGKSIYMSDLFDMAYPHDNEAKIILDRCLAEIGFDVAAVNAIIDKNTINFTGAYDGTVTLIGNEQVLGRFDFSLVDGNSQSISFGNGKVTVQMPFSATIPEGKELAVWFFENDEKSAQIPFTYENGILTFFPPSLSTYAVLLQDVQQTPADYSVALADGTEDATSWKGNVDDSATDIDLPITGLKGGEKVTLKYNGRRKVKSVTATVEEPKPSYTMAKDATDDDKGKLICTDGHIHAYGEDATCTAARVALIVWVGETDYATYNHGLALALTDEYPMDWDSAQLACGKKKSSTPVTNAEWLLAGMNQWKYMLNANGLIELANDFASVGGTNMQGNYYWSSDVMNNQVPCYSFASGNWLGVNKNTGSCYVRACLMF